MTEQEGIALLNQIANNLLGLRRVKRKQWFCMTCHIQTSKHIASLHRSRLGHETGVFDL